MRHWLSKSVMGLLVCVCATAQVYPGKTWEVSTPDNEGLDANALDAFAEFMGGRGCVVRHGRLAYTWGDVTKPDDVASAVKPWFTHFLFVAVETGRLTSVDERAARYAPCLAVLNPQLGHKDRNITFRHFANQTSCYGVSESPGTAFDYNDWQMALFVDTLFLGVYTTTYAHLDEEVLHHRLTDLLECEDSPTFFAFRREERAGRLAISPRDFARFGWLYLNLGRWKDKTLISQAHVELATRTPLPAALPRTAGVAAEMCPGQRSLGSEKVPDNQTEHFGSYSWLWWVNGVDAEGHRHWPDAPADTFAALGHRNGMRGMAVMPSLGLVAAWNDTRLGELSDDTNPLNEGFRRLVASVVGEGASH